MMSNVYFNNDVQHWLTAGGASVLLFVVLLFLKNRLHAIIHKLAGKTENNIDDMIAGFVKGTKWPVLMILSVYGASFLLNLSERMAQLLQAVTIITVLVQGTIWGNAIITAWVDGYRRRKLENNAAGAMTAGIIGFTIRIIFFSVVLLVALDNLGFDITTLVASLGIGGIAIALAVQNILSDLFSSLSIALDKPFVIGDFIIVDDYMGEVERVGLKTTRVRSLSGEQLVFANSDLLKSRIKNYKRMYQRRVVFKFGVIYQTTYDQLVEIPKLFEEIVKNTENTRFDRAHFASYGDSSLDFEVVYYVLVPDFGKYMDAQQTINLALFKAFEEKGIDFAYPTRTLYIEGGDRQQEKAEAPTEKS